MPNAYVNTLLSHIASCEQNSPAKLELNIEPLGAIGNQNNLCWFWHHCHLFRSLVVKRGLIRDITLAHLAALPPSMCDKAIVHRYATSEKQFQGIQQLCILR